MIHAATGCYGQGSFFCGGIDYCRFTVKMRDTEGFCVNAPAPSKESKQEATAGKP